MFANPIAKLTALFLISAAVSACSSLSEFAESSYYNNSSKTEAKADAANTDIASGTVAVAIKSFAFDPAPLTVTAGSTVVFTNEDGAPHTATASGGAFDTGTLAQGQSGTITLATAGTYDYICSVHPSMKGSITVQE